MGAGPLGVAKGTDWHTQPTLDLVYQNTPGKRERELSKGFGRIRGAVASEEGAGSPGLAGSAGWPAGGQ